MSGVAHGPWPMAQATARPVSELRDAPRLVHTAAGCRRRGRKPPHTSTSRTPRAGPDGSLFAACSLAVFSAVEAPSEARSRQQQRRSAAASGGERPAARRAQARAQAQARARVRDARRWPCQEGGPDLDAPQPQYLAVRRTRPRPAAELQSGEGPARGTVPVLRGRGAKTGRSARRASRWRIGRQPAGGRHCAAPVLCPCCDRRCRCRCPPGRENLPSTQRPDPEQRQRPRDPCCCSLHAKPRPAQASTVRSGNPTASAHREQGWGARAGRNLIWTRYVGRFGAGLRTSLRSLP